jgi:archaellum component FlaC
MPTDSILRLKIAFANIPMKGLFFWEGLLSLKDNDYKEIIEKDFRKTIDNFSENEKELATLYEEILEDLKTVRNEITHNLELKKEVEEIREALIKESAYKAAIDVAKEKILQSKV